MSRNLVRNKRALSPVIATVILVSVTIVVAVSVAYWMGTIASGYTAFEQIELPTSYSVYDSTLFSSEGGWNVTIELKNTGSADATIDNIFLNAIPLKDYNTSRLALYADGVSESLTAIDVSVVKGSSVRLVLQIQKAAGSETPAIAGCTSGTNIDLKLHTAAGQIYPVQVKLV